MVILALLFQGNRNKAQQNKTLAPAVRDAKCKPSKGKYVGEEQRLREYPQENQLKYEQLPKTCVHLSSLLAFI